MIAVLYKMSCYNNVCQTNRFMIHTAHDTTIICFMNNQQGSAHSVGDNIDQNFYVSLSLSSHVNFQHRMTRHSCLLQSLQLLRLWNFLWKVEASLLGLLARNWKLKIEEISKVGLVDVLCGSVKTEKGLLSKPFALFWSFDAMTVDFHSS